MNIAGREIGSHLPPYIIAELSCNHSGSFNKALALIDAAKEAGADAVKLQTYTPAELTTDPELTKVYQKAKTPRDWHAALFQHARDVGITIFSSAFSVDGVRFLEALDTPAHKIASFEIHDRALVQAAFDTGKPVILSTGLATEQDIAFKYIRNCVLLHCVSQYPARIEQANLNCIKTLQRHTPLVGLSDHTAGYETAIAATAMGAVMIEKHFKVDDDCLDAAYSLDPRQFNAMCKAVRSVWEGMGDGVMKPTAEPRKR